MYVMFFMKITLYLKEKQNLIVKIKKVSNEQYKLKQGKIFNIFATIILK